MTSYLRTSAAGVAAVMVAASAALAQSAPPLSRADTILGTRPTYTARALTAAPNAPAITARIWAPGLDDGYVPQGVAAIAGDLYISAYRPTSAKGDRGPCRVFRLALRSGETSATLDVPEPCGHAGGLAAGAARVLYVADTRSISEIALPATAKAGAPLGRVVRTISLTGQVKGSFAASQPGVLWLGSYERDAPGRLFALPHAALKTGTVSERDAAWSIVLPSKVQGAAFDAAGRLWLTRSNSKFGELLRLDGSTGAIEARFDMPAGMEDLSVDAAGMLWSVSEAGSQRWNGWPTFFPVAFRIDPARLVPSTRAAPP